MLWAQAIHNHRADVDGLVWMSARWNTDKAVVLFGDRVPTTSLHVHDAACRDFRRPADEEWLLDLLDSMHVQALARVAAT